MKPLLRRITLLLLLAAALPLFGQVEADAFYLQRLEAGKIAYQNERWFDAVAELRIASFGFLDRLDLLSESLARLAVAQQAAGMNEEAVATLQRFVDVEAVAGQYGTYGLEDDIEQALESILGRTIPDERLSGIRSLAHLHTSAVDQIMDLSGRERTRALEQAREKSSGEVLWYVLLTRDALERRSIRDARKWTERGLEVDPTETELLEVRTELDIRDGECESAWNTVQQFQPFPTDTAERVFLCLSDQGKDQLAMDVFGELERRGAELSVGAMRAAAELKTRATGREEAALEPAPTSRPPIVDETPDPTPDTSPQPQIIDQTPPSRDAVRAPEHDFERAQALVREGRPEEAKTILLSLSRETASRELDLAVLEAAVLTADWRLARTKLRDLTPLRKSEPASIFYAAVTLYESGRYEEAKRLFQVARPRIAESPLVTRYEQLILSRP